MIATNFLRTDTNNHKYVHSVQGAITFPLGAVRHRAYTQEDEGSSGLTPRLGRSAFTDLDADVDTDL